MSQQGPTAGPSIDPSLQTVARFLPYRRGLFARHLRLVRSGTTIAGKVAALRDARVIQVSATASVRLHRPNSPDGVSPAVLWIHGGGYVSGSAAIGDRAVRKIAEDVGALVASVEYRLAPEHRFPAALDDCYAALEWLAVRDDIDHRRILVVGKSAGGGLAAALTLRCVDAGLVDLAGQVLMYPMLDDRTVQRTTAAGARGWTPEDNEFGWRSYLNCEPGADRVSSYAAPARRMTSRVSRRPGSALAPPTFFMTKMWTTPTVCAKRTCRRSWRLFLARSTASMSSGLVLTRTTIHHEQTSRDSSITRDLG